MSVYSTRHMSWSKWVFFQISPLHFHKTSSGSTGVAYFILMMRRETSPQIHAESTVTLMVGWLHWSAPWSHLIFWGDMSPLSFGICACSHGTATSSGLFLLNQGSDIPQMCSEFLLWSTWELLLTCYIRMYDLFIS